MYKIDIFTALKELELSEKSRGLTKGTIKRNQDFVGRFLKYINSNFDINYVDEIRPNHIKAFLVSIFDRGNKPSYVNIYRKSIKAYFTYIEGEEYIEYFKNPMLRVPKMKEGEVLVFPWSDEDIQKMLDYQKNEIRNTRRKMSKTRGKRKLFVDERILFMIMLFIDTGMRLAELRNLREDHFSKDTIYIRNGKGGKDRIVFVSSIALKQKIKYERAKENYFSEWESHQQENFVFLNDKGRQLSADMAQRDIQNLAKYAKCDPKIRHSPHTFRHYFTQKMVENGANIVTIQRLLGHTSLRTTENYLRTLPNAKIVEQGLEYSPLLNLNKNLR